MGPGKREEFVTKVYFPRSVRRQVDGHSTLTSWEVECFSLGDGGEGIYVLLFGCFRLWKVLLCVLLQHFGVFFFK
jgi:hypothetical protein